MGKYIDADLLRKDIDNWKEAMADAVGEYSDGVRFALEHFTFVLDSLQQEQPDFPTTDEQTKEFLATHPKVEVPEKYKTPDFVFKKQEQPSIPDLDEAAEDFVWEVMENDEDGISDLSRKLTPWSKITDFYDALAEFFKAEAEWAIQQLKVE